MPSRVVRMALATLGGCPGTARTTRARLRPASAPQTIRHSRCRRNTPATRARRMRVTSGTVSSSGSTAASPCLPFRCVRTERSHRAARLQDRRTRQQLHVLHQEDRGLRHHGLRPTGHRPDQWTVRDVDAILDRRHRPRRRGRTASRFGPFYFIGLGEVGSNSQGVHSSRVRAGAAPALYWADPRCPDDIWEDQRPGATGPSVYALAHRFKRP